MKISKEQLIKLFKNSIQEIEIDSGRRFYLSDDYIDDKDFIMSYHISSGHMSLGTMSLIAKCSPKKCFFKIEERQEWQSFGMTYLISFRPYHNNNVKSESSLKEDKSTMEVRHELSNDEFVILTKIFKKKFDGIEKFYADSVDSEVKETLEILSDTYELDFFPKKRVVLIEKYKQPEYGTIAFETTGYKIAPRNYR